MSGKLHQIFKNIELPEPDAGLEKFIWHKVALADHQQIRRKLMLSYVGLVASIMAAIYTGWIFGQAFLQSEFWTFLQLGFSDASLLMGSWKDFLFSLLESFPALSVAAILVPIFTLMVSLYFSLNLNERINQKHFNSKSHAYGKI